MTGESYAALIGYFSKTTARKNTVIFISKYAPLLSALVYAAAVICLWIFNRDEVLIFVGIPALTFAVVTVFRALVNAPRPYDELEYTPMVAVKHGKGKSFPSRHTASAVIIAFACMRISMWFGTIMLALAVIIGTSRVIVGVHYPRDVITAAAISAIIGSVTMLCT